MNIGPAAIYASGDHRRKGRRHLEAMAASTSAACQWLVKISRSTNAMHRIASPLPDRSSLRGRCMSRPAMYALAKRPLLPSRLATNWARALCCAARSLARSDWINSSMWRTRIRTGTGERLISTRISIGTIQADAGLADARDPNIKPFLDHNGRLLRLGRPAGVETETTITYYKDVAKTVGAYGDRFADPHVSCPWSGDCGGGEGPNKFDTFAALEE